MSTVDRLMTIEEFLALPDDDGVERWLSRGVLRERPIPLDERETVREGKGRPIVTTRGYPHSVLMMRVGYLLTVWLRSQPRPRGRVIGGEAKVRLGRNPDTFAGVDVGYISPELAAKTPRNAKFVDEPPTLAVEILSPSDKHENIADKVEDYLAAGVPQVWVVDPAFETVAVFRPGALPTVLNTAQTIDGGPGLPGLVLPVAEVFED